MGQMIEGTFMEDGSDPHVARRRVLLETGPVLPPPAGNMRSAQAAEFPDGAAAEMREDLRRNGLAVVQLDAPLPADRFLALGRLLGTTMPETDPVVQPQVEHGAILNLVTRHGHTRDVALQPFATHFLTLHTESSARPASAQPRYIVLMCCDPGDNSTAAQTVLVPMHAVLDRMLAKQLAVLEHTRYRNSPDAPFIVRREDGRVVFSLRDFYEQPLAWTHLGAAAHEDEVNEAIRGLLAAMYASEDAVGIHWSRGMLVVMDNTFYFHGRTAGSATVSGQPRHLKRLRIIGLQ